eukprot:CAMPEP_0198285122 /NCGR_PEP_ID=MMETSP1449-20131203/4429_1 /TAXON_ID=420275 /ORGANISM="Attheya septentrionalis, Strain CCMP2084" /LENGTH=428 /DNA_ID=CAMNT_0043982391 /DNA_START=5 /DNA_END=1291 /DNA_ORIENTATION=+
MPKDMHGIPLAGAAVAMTAAAAAAVMTFFAHQKKTSTKDTYYLLAGDVGGTNTRLALYSPQGEELLVQHYRNAAVLDATAPSFEDQILIPFLTACQSDLRLKNHTSRSTNTDLSTCSIVACLACAGPVRHNAVRMTNMGDADDQKQPDMALDISGPDMEASTQGWLKTITRVKVINDFVAQGYGLLTLDHATETRELLPGSLQRMNMDPKGPKACVGAGTGLGECYLTTSTLLLPEQQVGYECYASEGGHVDYAPQSNLEVELWQFLKKKFNAPHRVSVERVVSGKGLANVYEFLSQRFPERIQPDIHQQFLQAGDMQGAVVGMNASQDETSLCHQAMQLMIRAYGSEVGNAAIKFIPTGGMYVSGGLTPKNISFIEGANSTFLKAYHDKGRVKTLLDTIPLFAVMVEDLGLRGAHVCAKQELKSMRK